MTFSRIRARMCASCAVWLLFIASACCVQGIQAPGNPPVASPTRPATAAKSATVAKPATAQAKKKPAARPPSSNAVARPATVSLKDGKLTIDANNSDLSQILRDVAAVSGMTIDGLGKSPRVFGAFGPGNPSDVLTELLSGSGYGFMMMGGTPGGAPRQLLLIAQNNDAPPPAAAETSTTTPPTPADSDTDAPANSGTDAPDEPGPGAITHVPPSERQAPTDSNSEQDQDRVQNNLERQQQIHAGPPPQQQ